MLGGRDRRGKAVVSPEHILEASASCRVGNESSRRKDRALREEFLLEISP